MEVNLLTPEVAIAVRFTGVVVGVLMALLSTSAFISHPSRASFWDFVASVVIAAAFVSLTLSAFGGQLAMSGDEQAHRMLVAVNLMLTTISVAGIVTLVLAWRPAKLER